MRHSPLPHRRTFSLLSVTRVVIITHTHTHTHTNSNLPRFALAYYESYTRRSAFQIVIFRKCFWYLIVNVIIIPTFLYASKGN